MPAAVFIRAAGPYVRGGGPAVRAGVRYGGQIHDVPVQDLLVSDGGQRAHRGSAYTAVQNN